MIEPSTANTVKSSRLADVLSGAYPTGEFQ